MQGLAYEERSVVFTPHKTIETYGLSVVFNLYLLIGLFIKYGYDKFITYDMRLSSA